MEARLRDGDEFDGWIDAVPDEVVTETAVACFEILGLLMAAMVPFVAPCSNFEILTSSDSDLEV